MNRFSLHRSSARHASTSLLPGLIALLLLLPSPAVAQLQPAPFEPTLQPVTLTLDEAIQIALVNNYTIRNNRLDVDNTRAQVREAWGEVMPQVDLSSGYTRNLKTANPFAGSEAGSLFSSFGFIDWLAFNERARTDDDPTSVPIAFGEFQDRRFSGLQDAGIDLGSGSDNPFSVENQFQNSVSITQTIFSGRAFAAIAGAQRLKEINERGVDRQEQVLVDQVRQAFYQALLTREQARVVAQSVTRTRSTYEEVAKRVAQGVAPKFQRLSAEVQLANQETELVRVQNQAASAEDNVKFTLGIPMDQPIQLRGRLEADDYNPYLMISAQNAFVEALDRRPDLDQTRLAIELRKIDKKLTRSEYLPTLSAFANFSYSGSIPDNRTITISDPNDPFSFSSRQNKFFSSSYWQPSINVGFRLTWNLFNGFRTSARLQQRQVAIERAELEHTQLQQSVLLEVEAALRNLETARQRIASQEQNVARAALSYEYASTRLREGVATPLEERDASDQLDQSRLNYLQAVFDYLVARSAFETAAGVPLNQQTDLKLTSN
ncbi:MAG: TolC family protein [Rhodothermales bacterium]